jgi:hypothetical protein
MAAKYISIGISNPIFPVGSLTEINTNSKLTHNHLRHAPTLVAHKALTKSSTSVNFLIEIVSIESLTNIFKSHFTINSTNYGYVSSTNLNYG